MEIMKNNEYSVHGNSNKTDASNICFSINLCRVQAEIHVPLNLTSTCTGFATWIPRLDSVKAENLSKSITESEKSSERWQNAIILSRSQDRTQLAHTDNSKEARYQPQRRQRVEKSGKKLEKKFKRKSVVFMRRWISIDQIIKETSSSSSVQR